MYIWPFLMLISTFDSTQMNYNDVEIIIKNKNNWNRIVYYKNIAFLEALIGRNQKQYRDNYTPAYLCRFLRETRQALMGIEGNLLERKWMSRRWWIWNWKLIVGSSCTMKKINSRKYTGKMKEMHKYWKIAEGGIEKYNQTNVEVNHENDDGKGWIFDRQRKLVLLRQKWWLCWLMRLYEIILSIFNLTEWGG